MRWPFTNKRGDEDLIDALDHDLHPEGSPESRDQLFAGVTYLQVLEGTSHLPGVYLNADQLAWNVNIFYPEAAEYIRQWQRMAQKIIGLHPEHPFHNVDLAPLFRDEDLKTALVSDQDGLD